MPARARFALFIGLLVAAVAAPATAHPPDQHNAQELSAGEALTGLDLRTQLGTPVSTSFRCEDGMAGPYPCENVDLEGFVPLPMLGGASRQRHLGLDRPEHRPRVRDHGHHHEHRLRRRDRPDRPVLVGMLPTRGIPDNVLWRDIKVDGNYAFIVSEITDSGLQVFDLTRLRATRARRRRCSTPTRPTTSSATRTTSRSTRRPTTPTLVGTNTCGNNGENGGLHMVDISDPSTPTFAGCALVDTFAGDASPTTTSTTSSASIYRGPDADYQGREICFGSNENVVAIYDVTDKANPTRDLDDGLSDGAAYTHQGSLTAGPALLPVRRRARRAGATASRPPPTSWTSATSTPRRPRRRSRTRRASIDHNLYIHGKRVYESNYAAGLRILEYDDASLAGGAARRGRLLRRRARRRYRRVRRHLEQLPLPRQRQRRRERDRERGQRPVRAEADAGGRSPGDVREGEEVEAQEGEEGLLSDGQGAAPHASKFGWWPAAYT